MCSGFIFSALLGYAGGREEVKRFGENFEDFMRRRYSREACRECDQYMRDVGLK